MYVLHFSVGDATRGCTDATRGVWEHSGEVRQKFEWSGRALAERASWCCSSWPAMRAREPWHAPMGLVSRCSKVPKQSVRLRPVSAASRRARILTAGCTRLQGSRMACAFIQHGSHTPHRPWKLTLQSMVRTCCSSPACFPAASLPALRCAKPLCIHRSAGLKHG